jgi:hypothetical protein
MVLSFSSLALAAGATPQNHHCQKDGAELAGKTKKECKKDGGTWVKNAAAPAAAKAPAGEDKAAAGEAK